MINKKNGTVSEIEIQLMNGELISFPGAGSPWYFEFKDGFLEVCSNSQPVDVKAKRDFIPLINIKCMTTKDIGEVI